MSFLKLFRKKEQPVQVETQQASATLYPDQILIATEDRTLVGYSISTPKVTKLPVDAIAEVIGRTVRKHLSLSETNVPAPIDFKAMYQDFLNAAGHKNSKAYHKGARHLLIYQNEHELLVTPTINGGSSGKERGFQGSKDIPSIHLNVSLSDEELGNELKQAWPKCIDNSV